MVVDQTYNTTSTTQLSSVDLFEQKKRFNDINSRYQEVANASCPERRQHCENRQTRLGSNKSLASRLPPNFWVLPVPKGKTSRLKLPYKLKPSACPNPKRRIILTVYGPIERGCGRYDCPVCRYETDQKFFNKLRADILRELAKAEEDRPLFLKMRFSQACQSVFSALPHSQVRRAATLALRDVRRPRIGNGIKKRSAWAGCRLEWFRGTGLNKKGILHEHFLIKVRPLPDAKVPSVDSLRTEILHYFRQGLRLKNLPKEGAHLLFLEECNDPVAVANYITLKQGGQFAKGFRRHGRSRGYYA